MRFAQSKLRSPFLFRAATTAARTKRNKSFGPHPLYFQRAIGTEKLAQAWAQLSIWLQQQTLI